MNTFVLVAPLPKTHGWGVHHDGDGRLTLYADESAAYQQFASGAVQDLQIAYAMRSKRDT